MSQTIVFICKKNWVIYRVCFDFDASQREWKLIFMRLFHPLGELSVTIGLHLQRSKFRGLFTLLIALSPCKMLCHVQSIGIIHLWLKRFVNGHSYLPNRSLLSHIQYLKVFCSFPVLLLLGRSWTTDERQRTRCPLSEPVAISQSKHTWKCGGHVGHCHS